VPGASRGKHPRADRRADRALAGSYAHAEQNAASIFIQMVRRRFFASYTPSGFSPSLPVRVRTYSA
jgi:hypothetical protein